MKAQMKFQKILSLLTLIIGALCFVYALCFFSGNLSDLMFYKGKDWGVTYEEQCVMSDYFIDDGQLFVKILVVVGIVYVCAAAFLYLTDTNKRRNYYVTNYVAIGIAIGVAAVTAILCIAFMIVLLIDFSNIEINFEDTSYGLGYMYEDLQDQGAPIVTTDTYMFVIGFVVAIIALANAVAWALTLTWKIKLMKGEKALLEGGLVKEVA